MRRQNRNALSKSGFLLIPELSEALTKQPRGAGPGATCPKKRAVTQQHQVAIEGVISDVVFDFRDREIYPQSTRETRHDRKRDA